MTTLVDVRTRVKNLYAVFPPAVSCFAILLCVLSTTQSSSTTHGCHDELEEPCASTACSSTSLLRRVFPKFAIQSGCSLRLGKGGKEKRSDWHCVSPLSGLLSTLAAEAWCVPSSSKVSTLATSSLSGSSTTFSRMDEVISTVSGGPGLPPSNELIKALRRSSDQSNEQKNSCAHAGTSCGQYVVISWHARFSQQKK